MNYSTNYPAFPKAQKQLQDSLAKYQWPKRLAWIKQHETIYLGHQWYIIENADIYNPDRVKREYELATTHPHGIMFSAICANTQYSYCYLYMPNSSIDARHSSIADGQLKIMIPTIKTPCYSVKNAIQATLLKDAEKQHLPWKRAKFEG